MSRASVLRVGDLEVDRLTQHVKRAGKTIELTPKEYALLEYLATHPGRVFSRTMIIEHVWDQSFEGLTNIVDVYVRHLRSKVDDPFPTKIIKTVRVCRLWAPREHGVVNTHSLSFRLVTWYAGVLTLVFVLLGALTIVLLHEYLESAVFDIQARRARQIADTLVRRRGAVRANPSWRAKWRISMRPR